MRTIFFYITFFGLFSSCTTLKQLSNQKIENKVGCSDMFIKDQKLLINVEVDNQKQLFLFDTGATLSVITDTTAVANYSKKEKGSFGSMKGADNKKNEFLTITSKLNSELFFSENKLFANMMQTETKCQKKVFHKGIIGLDAFFGDGKPLLIDFSNNKLCNIKKEEKNELVIKGYSKIKSECKSGKVYVFLTIEGKEHRFKLDTGFYGNVIMPYTEKIDLSEYNSWTYEGILLKTINSIANGEETYYENVAVSAGNFNFQTKVQISKTITAQNLGLNFMKSFDWIIDFDNNEVYLKRNKSEMDSLFKMPTARYYTMEKNGKLIVSSKLKGVSEYNVGDEIIEVGNQKITSENICEMQKLLNQTNDWSALKIKTNAIEKL